MGMALPQHIDKGLDCAAAQVLGWRAHWLRLHLMGEAAGAMTDRDRAVLTLVATSPKGIDAGQLLAALRVGGVARTAGAGRISRLVEEGWLSRTGEVIDLPQADTAWIATQVSHPGNS